MRQLTTEQIEYARGRLVCLMEFRGIRQAQLASVSGVHQSTISKLLSHEHGVPSTEVLGKLFQGLGLKLEDIVNEPDCLPSKILGYLATPLTGLTSASHAKLRDVVNEIRAVAADRRFDPPPFDIYWPGDHTHPIDNANLLATQVYVTDRSRASTHDFVILFCATPSYGVGQENEIVTQAGLPAIRLVPQTRMSRMMLGSFVRAIDVEFAGTLDLGVRFKREALVDALREIRRLHFRHRALYRGWNSAAFGSRLKRLVDDRCGGDYPQFADDLGIGLSYLLNLMNEPFGVSNPSARLLSRIAARLGERVAYLLGESEDVDPIWVESNSSWEQWIHGTSGVDGAIALELRDKWRNDYRIALRDREPSSASFRNTLRLMQVSDWDAQYQKLVKSQGGSHAAQKKLV